MATYNCPACGNEFEPKQRKGKKCPHCEIELKANRKTKKTGGFYYEYVVANPDSQETAKKLQGMNSPAKPDRDKIDTIAYGECIHHDGSFKIHQNKEAGEEVNPNWWLGGEYTLLFTNAIYTDWIYCPNCKNKLFQNRQLHSGNFSHNHKCRNSKCKASITVIFRRIVAGQGM